MWHSCYALFLCCEVASLRFQSISESPMAHWLDGTFAEIKLECCHLMSRRSNNSMYSMYFEDLIESKEFSWQGVWCSEMARYECKTVSLQLYIRKALR